jgi:hypothetical protein
MHNAVIVLWCYVVVVVGGGVRTSTRQMESMTMTWQACGNKRERYILPPCVVTRHSYC